MTQGSNEHFRADRHADEDIVPFDVRDYSGRRAMWLLLITVIILLTVAFMVFRMYQDGARDRNAPPRIGADNSPYKVAPENPGGQETPNQDKTVYDVMNGTAKMETVTAKPGPEEPIDLPRQATIIVQDDEPTRTNSEPSKPVTRQPNPVRSGGSDYVVQVASVRARADAETLWGVISQKFETTLPAGTYSDIRRVDLNEKGIYYRLRVAGLADKNAAAQLCRRFEARNQACFVTRR